MPLCPCDENPSDDMPAGKQADRPARAYAAIGSAKLAFRSRQDVIDFIFHRLER